MAFIQSQRDELEVLAPRAAAGDQAALETLLGVVQPEVLRICSRFLPFRGDAEEACQDALLKVARHIGSFRGDARFTTWLHQVAANSARSTYRTLKRRPATPTETDALDRPDPARVSVVAGTRLDVLEALDKLQHTRPLLVEPIVLRDLNGLDYAEIAEALDVPLSTIKSRIHEGRQLLREWLLVQP